MSEVKIPLFERKATGLVREIGPLGLLAITMSYAIGAGINMLSVKNGYLYPGSNVGLGFLIAGIPVTLVAVCYALLAITIPRSGGAYVFISRIVSPTWGFLASWASWFGGWLLMGIVAYYDGFFWGLMMWTIGLAFHNQPFINTGLWMMKPINSFWIGVIVLIIALIICSLRIGIVIRILEALWLIPVIGSIIMLAAYGMHWGLASANPAAFKAKWDAIMGAGSYDEVMKVALSHGFDVKTWTTFSWSSTWLVGTYSAMFAYGSPATPPTAVAGEVKTPTKTQLWGTVIGTILVVIYYTLVSALAFGACDPFIRAYTFNFYEGYAKEYTITPAALPCLPLFAGILSGNMTLAIVFAVSAAVWLFNVIPTFFLYLTRFIFAWAFDRTFPRIFAEVHPTLRSPIYANILVFILAVIACGMCWGWWIYKVFVLLDQVACLGWVFPDLFVALAAAVLPLVRRDLYKTSPISAWEIAGIPICTIFGILGFFGISMFVFAIFGLISTGSVPFGPKIVKSGGVLTADLLFFIASLTIGLVISLIYQYKAAKEGIPVSDIFREIPPA